MYIDSQRGSANSKHFNSPDDSMPLSRRNFAKMGAMGLAAPWLPHALAQLGPVTPAAVEVQTSRHHMGSGSWPRQHHRILWLAQKSPHNPASPPGLAATATRPSASPLVPLRPHQAPSTTMKTSTASPPTRLWTQIYSCPAQQHARRIHHPRAGKHVLCEKPMHSAQCVRVVVQSRARQADARLPPVTEPP